MYGLEKDGADEPICKVETGCRPREPTGTQEGNKGWDDPRWFCTPFLLARLFTNSRSVENKNFDNLPLRKR